MLAADSPVDFNTRTVRKFHGQGHSAGTILTCFADTYPIIHTKCYNVRKFKDLPPAGEIQLKKFGSRPMHATTMSLRNPVKLDYETTVKHEFGGSKVLPPSRRPPICQSMHTSHFQYAHRGHPMDFQNDTHHRRQYYDKGTQPAQQVHYPTLNNKMKMNTGEDMRTVIHTDQDTNYFTQYNKIHNKLGAMLGPGVRRPYVNRRQYNIITGREVGVAWSMDDDNKRTSGNRVLSASRGEERWNPIS